MRKTPFDKFAATFGGGGQPRIVVKDSEKTSNKGKKGPKKTMGGIPG